MGGEGVILFRTSHTAEAELSSHHNTRTTRTMTIWLKDKFAPQRRIKMQIVVQKIANAVTEKGNLKIFRDVVKDSNSEKIAGRKTIQGGFIWFPSESERRKKKNENIYIVGLKMQHLEVCKEPLETCNCCQLWVDLLSVDFIIYPQIIPVSEFYCNSRGAKICNSYPTFYLREFIFFICSWWRASPAKMLAQNDWSTEIMTTRVWRWQKIFSINTTDRDEKCKWKAEVMQLRNSTETKKSDEILQDEILQDYFRFRVEVDDELRAEGEFLIHVYPESYWWVYPESYWWAPEELNSICGRESESSSWGIFYNTFTFSSTK